MKANQKPWVLLLIAPFLGVITYALWHSSPARAADAVARKVLFYQDSMHPWVKSDRPGKCTICGMDLTPISEGQTSFGLTNVVVLSSNGVTVLNVQTEAVQRRSLVRSLRVAGTLEANEGRKAVLSAPARGRIEGMAIEYAGVEVEKGQPLICFFSPDLLALWRSQFVANSPNQGTNGAVTTGRYTADLIAPLSGVVLERNVYSGQYVAEGDRLLTIADASVLWFRFDVYERQLPWFEVGQTIAVETPGVPGKLFAAEITFVEPTVNEATRTIKVRAEVRNPLVEINGHKRRLLKYGMYAEGRVRAEVPEAVAVPRAAILFPGAEAYAYVERGDGAYERRRVKLGRQGDELWEVLQGLAEGERVVTSGNVLMDAQAQFNQPARAGEPAAEEMASPPPAVAEGVMGGPMNHSMASVSVAAEAPVAAEKGPKPPEQMPDPLPGAPANAAMPDDPRQLALARRAEAINAVVSQGELEQVLRLPIIARRRGLGVGDGTAAGGSQHMAPAAGMTEKGGLPLAGTTGSAGATGVQVNCADSALVSPTQCQQIEALVREADAISAALAADDLTQFNTHAAELPGALVPVRKELAVAHHWEKLMEPLEELGNAEPAKDLAQARARFLPFSTAVVAWVRLLRKEAPGLTALKIYHCPMAPKPGLWMQVGGPLANPFYGKKMLKCGEEVECEGAASASGDQ
jgi:Cu(I)/Ag(I) efflux system membrane fusion protein